MTHGTGSSDSIRAARFWSERDGVSQSRLIRKARPISASGPASRKFLANKKTGWNVNSNRLRMQGYVWLPTAAHPRGRSGG